MRPGDPAAPPPDAILIVDPVVLAGALLAIPDGENALLRLADGRRTVEEVVAGSGLDAAAASVSLIRLLDAGVLRVVAPGAAPGPEAQPGPEAADWFAHPASAAEPEPGPPPVPAAVAPPVTSRAETTAPPERIGDGRRPARGWLAVAALTLGAVAVAGAVWAQRQRGASPPPRLERPAPDRPPPALAITEPAPATAYRDALLEVGARHQAGDLEGAAAACRRAIAIDPAAGAGWLALGEVSLAAGDRDRARSSFEHYLAVEPGGPHAARVRALLERLRP